jgi:tRNA A-37 threonylcarbamoyl transferase component Bud32/tetratricopeptide (TPR) repeat protein
VSDTDLTREGGPLAQRLQARGLRRGDVLGRYVIVGAIGKGGMGAVYEAYDTQLARRVAVKVLHPSSNTEERQARLSREAQAMARLSHPNVVTVYDVGTFEGGLFIAMELIQGPTLKKWIAEPHPFREVLAKVSAAGRGLAAAHAAGLVHRDFKPENVLLGDDGRVVVTDFGIARAEGTAVSGSVSGSADTLSNDPGDDPDATLPQQPVGGLGEPITRKGAILGTLGYFAPELAGEEREDARSDQFGFCATLYRALYRRSAFTGDTLNAYIASARKGPRPPPAGAGVPGWVHQVIVKGLSVRPEDRYPSMDALLAALARDPTRVRRRWMGAGAALALVALGALGVVRRDHARLAECDAAGRAVDEVWSGPVRAAVREALGSPSGDARDGGGGTAQRILTAVDDYAARWRAVRVDVCRSARRPEGEAAARLAAGCLEHAREELAAVVELLGRSHEQNHQRALHSVYSLLHPDACTSPTLSHGYAALPADADAGARARALSIFRQQAQAHALYTAGRYREALATDEKTLAAARTENQVAAQAVSLMNIGDVQLRLGNATEAIGAYLESIGAAESASHDDIAGRSAAMIAFAAKSNLHRDDEARRWLAIARGKLSRLGHDDLLEAAILHTDLLLASGSEPLDRTLPRYERLLLLDERIWGKVSDKAASETNNLAIALAAGGDHARAIDEYQRSLSIKEQLYGPDHPDLSSSLENLAGELCALGRYTEAEVPAGRALALVEKLGREGDLKLAWALLPLAFISGRHGDAGRALALADRALAIAGAHGEDAAGLLADLLVIRGDALLALGRTDEATASCARALARMEHEDRVSPGKLYEPDPLTCLGEADLRRGHSGEAVATLERSVALERRGDQATLSFARFALARALRAAGRDPSRARALAGQARAALEGLPELAPRLAEVDAWLSAGGPGTP